MSQISTADNSVKIGLLSQTAGNRKYLGQSIPLSQKIPQKTNKKWNKTKQKNLIVEKQTRREDDVSWEIVTIYLRAEMKKSEFNSGWWIPGKNSRDMNSTVCALHVMSMFLTSQLAHCAGAANKTRSALWQQYATILTLFGCRQEG